MTIEPLPERLTADAFLAWAAEQPRGRFELAAGAVVAMAPERAGHARAKLAAVNALAAGIAARGLPCEALPVGMSVRIDATTVYEPDALVRCGAKLADDAVVASDPVVVVEVVSPSSRALDTGAKLADYFRLPSVRHYLVVNLAARAVVHHARDAEGAIATAIVRDGRLELDPPGIGLAVADLLPLP